MNAIQISRAALAMDAHLAGTSFDQQRVSSFADFLLEENNNETNLGFIVDWGMPLVAKTGPHIPKVREAIHQIAQDLKKYDQLDSSRKQELLAYVLTGSRAVGGRPSYLP